MAYKENLELPGLPVKYFVSASEDRKPITTQVHWHNAVEVLHVLEGAARQQLDDTFTTLAKGDWAVIWSNQFHSTYSVGNQHCCIGVLQINIGSFLASFLEANLAEELKSLAFYDKIKPDSRLCGLFSQIISELMRQKEGYSFRVSALIYQVCSEILSASGTLPVQFTKKYNDNDKKIASKIFGFIHENYKDPITLRQAANAVGLSTNQFLRVFKKISGMTFKQYLNSYRVNQAAVLIQNGENVTEAGLSSGFDNINTFIRNFKKFKNCLPSKLK